MTTTVMRAWPRPEGSGERGCTLQSVCVCVVHALAGV